MTRFIQLALLAMATSVTQVQAQCPNDLIARGEYFPYRTMTSNSTWFLVPVNRAAVEQAIDDAFAPSDNFLSFRLLEHPFWLDLPPYTHPVLINSGVYDKIQQDKWKLHFPLRGANSMVPFVGLNSSVTPLNLPLSTYLQALDAGAFAGGFSQRIAQLFGWHVRLGVFEPQSAAYRAVGDGIYSLTTSKVFGYDPARDGAGNATVATDVVFNTVKQGKYSLEQWESVINQPLVMKSVFGKCTRNTHFFNLTASNVQFRSGNVTIGFGMVARAGTPSMMGTHPGVEGISACTQVIEYESLADRELALGEDCDWSARNVESQP